MSGNTTRILQLLRALFPSWRFFDDPGEAPVLYHRVSGKNEDWQPWVPCLPPARRSLSALFFNPEGSYLFAAHSLVRQLADDLGDMGDTIEASVSFRLVRNLVETEIARARGKAPSPQDPQAPGRYQFKLCAVSAETTSDRAHPDTLMISPEYGAMQT